jgi:hypothetical protein
MKLLAYILNGTPINELTEGYNPEYLNGNKPFLSSVNDVKGYADISSVENWDLFGTLATDYIFSRYEIEIILIPKANPNYPTIDFSGWNSLSDSEKLLMAKHVLAPKSLRITILSTEEDYYNWKNLIIVTKENREKLIEEMRLKVAYSILEEEMNIKDSQDFFKDLFPLTEFYINTASPDFKFWITNAVGTPYENDGFAQKVYYSVGLKNSLVDIYEGVTE